MNTKLQITNTIKQCMRMHKPLTKDYIKILRKNKKIKPIRINKRNKNRLSIQFDDEKKTSLVIPRKCGKHHIQLHLDKYYKLVRYMKSELNMQKCHTAYRLLKRFKS